MHALSQGYPRYKETLVSGDWAMGRGAAKRPPLHSPSDSEVESQDHETI